MLAKQAAVVLVSVALTLTAVGCGTGSGDSGTSADASSAGSGAPAATRASSGAESSRSHRHREGTGAQAARAGRLQVSNASSHVVQPQPPAGSCHARGSGFFSLPDPRCTPGSVSPAVTQSDIHSTICVTGYTRRVRPSESITEEEKRASLAAYGDTQPLSDYEYDHLVPLELGGAANDPHNLWPEPGRTPNPKDRLELRLHDMVCEGTLSLATAQREIADDWIAAYRRVVG